MMSSNQELFIPVILGTVRQGRQSEYAARFVSAEIEKREGVRTELIDIRELSLPVNDEYFDPFEGTAYGTDSFSWTAALTLDVALEEEA